MRLQRLLLERELQAWRQAGKTAQLWWRDDGARDESPELRRLLALADRRGVKPTLAVAPSEDLSRLSDCLRAAAPVTVAQYGFEARRRSQPPEGGRCGRSQLSAQMRQGWLQVADLPGALKVFVSPQRDVDPLTPGALEEGGYLGWSAWGHTGPRGAPPRIDAHLDILRWRSRSCFCGEARFLRGLRFVLEDRRARANWAAPVGLLTHHLAHDEAAWAFLGDFLEWTLSEPAVEWRALGDLLSGASFSEARTADQRQSTPPSKTP